jgi:hypothetical protein
MFHISEFNPPFESYSECPVVTSADIKMLSDPIFLNDNKISKFTNKHMQKKKKKNYF